MGFLRRHGGLAAILALLAVHLLSAAGRSFWEDEVATLRSSAAAGVPERFEGPFFLWLVRAWSCAGESEIGLRLLPILVALGGAAAAAALSGRLALLLLALSPAFSLWARELRPYGLFFLLAVLTALFWRRWESQGRRRDLAWSVGLSTAAFWIHQAFLLQAAALALWSLTRRRITGLWLFAGPAATALLAALLWPDLFATIARNVDAQLEGGASPLPGGAAGRAAYGLFVFALGETVWPLNLWVVLPAAAAFGAGVVLGFRALPREDRAFWAIWAALPLLVAAVWGARFGPKYLIPSLLPFLVLLARGAAARPAILVVILGASVYASINDALGREHHNMARVEPVREVAERIMARGFVEGDELVLAPQHQALAWYLRGAKGACLTQKHGEEPRRTGGLYYLLCSPGQDRPELLDEARRRAEALGPPDELLLWCEDPLAEDKARWVRKPFLRWRLELRVWDRR